MFFMKFDSDSLKLFKKKKKKNLIKKKWVYCELKCKFHWKLLGYIGKCDEECYYEAWKQSSNSFPCLKHFEYLKKLKISKSIPVGKVSKL